MAGLAAAAGLVVAAGCPAYGIVGDGTSVSWGVTNRGVLLRPAVLPARGDGYWIPPRWAKRGLRYGTDEMVDAIVHVGRQIDREFPGSALGVGDLSTRRGGPSAWHRSHQNGRDADLLLFAVDAAGKPVRLEQMVPFRADGTAEIADPEGGPPREIRFDVARNWYLVRAMTENPIVAVQYLFLYEPLQQMLLEHARAIGEPEAVIVRASRLLLQPGDSLPHNDHLHLRILCAHTDRAVGCVDRGRIRWAKKLYKYASRLLSQRVRGVLGATLAALRALPPDSLAPLP